MNILRNQISVTFLLIAFIALGQEITDTITPKQLQEVVISAPKVIRKADKSPHIRDGILSYWLA